MSESEDPELDLLKQCRLGPEFEPEAAHRIDSSIEKKRRKRFVMFPQLWIERLEGARNAGTYRVALRVLQKHRKCKGQPFPLPNNIGGVSRWGKSTALRELEKAGLIRVERRKRKSPLVLAVTLDQD